MEQKTTPLGLGENIEGALAYVLGWISGILFLVLEPKNDFVRFHAMQSIVTFGGLTILSIVLGMIPVIGWILTILLAPVIFVLWLWLMWKAYQGERYKLPTIGDFAEQQLPK